MEFLDNLVLPQSAEHIELLHYLQILVFFLLLPYLAILFGGTIVSLNYKRKFRKTGNGFYYRFAKDIIETVTINKSIGVIAGIIPLVTTILIYTQLLHSSGSISIIYFFFALLFDITALIIIFTYRYSLIFNEIFESVEKLKTGDELAEEEFIQFRYGARALSFKSGKYGLVFLALTVWFLIAGITSAIYYEQWADKGFFSQLLNLVVLTRFIYFILISLALTGCTILFGFFFWEGGKKGISEDYKQFIREKSVRFTLISAIFLPVFILINIFSIPSESLSGIVFGFGMISLLLIFITYHFLYVLTSESYNRFSGLSFFFMLAVVLVLIVSDQQAMSNSTELRSQVLSLEFEKHLAELKGENTAAVINAEEIYQTRCAACHRFDVKLVGPPYNETLPKYEGKLNQLIAFIRNPVKVNPDYPPMPNPALKPNEAEAIAKYLLETYKK
ncbi:MAG: hypothetical protein Kow0098_17750 [Ignavibacteriaceae bacterium]